MDYELQIYAENQLRRERQLRDRLNPLEHYNEQEVKKLFRFEPINILEITNRLEHRLHRPTERNKSLQPLQQVCLALRFYASGSMQLSLGAWTNIDQSTVSRVVWDVTSAICDSMKEEIRFPNDLVLLKQSFYERSGLANVVGCIDGTHVPIQQPVQFGQEYINRKNWYSINVQAVCDANCKVMDVVASWPGSAHDSRIFRNSALYQKLQQGQLDGILLGDSGYRLAPFLFTPFNNPAIEVTQNFNRIHASTRNCIERTFGQIKRRFAALHIPLRLKLDRLCPTIIACFVLHNVAKNLNDPEPFDDPMIPVMEQPVLEMVNYEMGERHLRNLGAARRLEAANHLI